MAWRVDCPKWTALTFDEYGGGANHEILEGREAGDTLLAAQILRTDQRGAVSSRD